MSSPLPANVSPAPSALDVSSYNYLDKSDFSTGSSAPSALTDAATRSASANTFATSDHTVDSAAPSTLAAAAIHHNQIGPCGTCDRTCGLCLSQWQVGHDDIFNVTFNLAIH